VAEEHAAVQEQLTSLQEQHKELQELDMAAKVGELECRRKCTHQSILPHLAAISQAKAPSHCTYWHCQIEVLSGTFLVVAPCLFDMFKLIMRCHKLQGELAALQADLAASKATAAAELEAKTQELDSMKNKLHKERTTNKRHMELSAEVCSGTKLWHRIGLSITTRCMVAPQFAAASKPPSDADACTEC